MIKQAYAATPVPVPDVTVIDQQGFLTAGDLGVVMLVVVMVVFVMVGAITINAWLSNRVAKAIAEQNNEVTKQVTARHDETIKEVTLRHDEREKETNKVMQGFQEILTKVETKIDRIEGHTSPKHARNNGRKEAAQ